VTVPTVSTGSAARTVHVERCMGTVFTIDVRDPGDWSAAVAEAVRRLHEVDATFSTYRPDSDISRLGRGELKVRDAHPDVAVVLDLCGQTQRATGGSFTSVRGGRLDPTGLVKGWGVDRASDLLRAAGSANHAVNGGGDVRAVGESAPGRPWVIGITDPRDPRVVLSTITGRDLAVATSGVAERGAHIHDPFTGRPATGLSSATVAGPRLTEVDAYATAAFVMGEAALSWVDALPGFEALLVAPDGTVRTTSGWCGQKRPDRSPITTERCSDSSSRSRGGTGRLRDASAAT
jgi:thiamine biosynthesis lipoprotein